MEVLIAIGAIFLAIIVIVALFPLLVAVSIIAFLAWLVSNATGLPFWAAFVLVAVIGVVGYILHNT